MPSIFRRSRPLHFSRNDTTKPLSHPLRRWLYHRIFGGVCCAGLAFFIFSYQRAKRESIRYHDDAGDCLCSSGMVDAFMMLPSNRFSSFVGSIASSPDVPRAVHQACIRAIVKMYGVDLSDSTQDEFDTLQEFYTRTWKAERRPTDAEALVVAPCDGEVMSIVDGVEGTSLMQVKGLHYSIQTLFRPLSQELPPGHKRVAVVIRLRIQDHHHVVAPTNFKCLSSVYVPGALLPTTPAGLHWIPGVLINNERVVLHGEVERRLRSSGGIPPKLFLAMVGSTLTGKISINVDERVKTNFLDPPEYAVRTPYETKPLQPVGTRVGSFQWGSTVAMLVDVPEWAEVRAKVGDEVKVGQQLVARGKIK